MSNSRMYVRISTLAKWLLVASMLSVSACGSPASSLAPDLPGTGTEHLKVLLSQAPAVSLEPVDPWNGHKMIAAPEAQPAVALPEPLVERFTLSNGLRVIAVHDGALPVTSLQVAIGVGSREVPRDKMGMATFAAQVMLRGTKIRSAARIAKEVESVGGELHSSASREATLLSCKSMSSDFATCLSVVSDLVRNANFPASEVALVRSNLQASVRQRLDDAGQLASAHFQSALWGSENSAGWIMSPATIEAISRADLLAWYKTRFLPNNAILAVSGDFDAKTIREELERTFRRWRKGEVAKTGVPSLPKREGLKIRLVDKPGQTQSHIRIGRLGLAHGDPDFYAASVFNYSLGGGGFSSRLMKTVRSAEGKAYSASSRFDRYRDVGAFVASTFTRSAETVSTVKLMQRVIAKMAKAGPTEEELNAAIQNMSGSYGMRFETAGDFGSALLAADLHGLGPSYVGEYPLRIAAVTRAQAAKAAARLLGTDGVVLVIVGDAKVVAPQMEEAGWDFEQVSFREPISDWEREKVRGETQARSDPAASAAATKLLEEALAVKGGAARLLALKSFHWTADATLKLPTGGMTGEVEKRYLKPSGLRLDMSIGGGQVKIVTALLGDTGWALEDSPRGRTVRDFGKSELAPLSNQLWRDADLVLLRHREKGAHVKSLAPRDLAGNSVIVVEVGSDDGRSVTLLIDERSRLLVGMEYSDQGMKTSERFGDYKKIGGIQIAFKRSTKGPQVNLEVRLKSFEANQKIDATLFARPAKVRATPK